MSKKAIHYTKYISLVITLLILFGGGIKGYTLLQAQAEGSEDDIFELKEVQKQQTQNIGKILMMVQAQETRIAVQETTAINIKDNMKNLKDDMQEMKEDTKEDLREINENIKELLRK